MFYRALLKVILFFSICTVPFGGYAQNIHLVDSLTRAIPQMHDTNKVVAYIDIFIEYLYVDLNKAKLYSDSSMMAAKRSGNASLITGSRNVLGVYYNMVSEFDSALVVYQKVKSEYEKQGNRERVSAVLNNIASSYQSLGDLEKSLAMHMEALAIKEELGVTGDDLASSYWNIGNVLSEIKNYEESNEWYYKAQEIYKEINDNSSLLSIRELLAQNLNQMGATDEAFEIYKELSVLFREANRPNDLAGVLDNMGRELTNKGQYKEAEEYLLEALDLAVSNGEKQLPGFVYRRLSQLYLKTKEYRKAEKYALLSLENAESVQLNKKKINDYLVLSEVYENLGQNDKAYSHFKDYHMLYDSILGLEKIQAINELEVKYQSEKKEQEIILLEEKSKRSNLEKKGMIGGIAGLICLFGAIIYAMRQRLISSKLAKEKSDQELIFSQKELDLRKQELTAYALQLAHKNEVLEGIKISVADMKKRETNHRDFQQIVNTIDFNKSDDESWEGFRTRFQAIHKDFETNVKKAYPKVTSNELRLMSLLKMNLTSKEIANILNISADGIKKARYRLRKKLGLETTDSLEALIIALK